MADLLNDAVTTFLELFTEGDRRNQWKVVYPPGTGDRRLPKAITFIIPSTNDFFKERIGDIRIKVDEWFEKERSNLQNTSFWRYFFHSLSFELSDGLENPPSSEAEVCHQLIYPFLKKIADFSPSIQRAEVEDERNGQEQPNVQSFYTSKLHVQYRTDPPGTKGGGRAVDFMLSGYIGDDPIYRIPVEVKKGDIDQEGDNMRQLSLYMCSITKGDRLEKNSVQGILINTEVVHFAFCPYSISVDGNDDMPLPVVFISPALQWRDGIQLDRSACIAICLFNSLRFRRIPIGNENGDIVPTSTEQDWQHAVEEYNWDGIIAAAKQVTTIQ